MTWNDSNLVDNNQERIKCPYTVQNQHKLSDNIKPMFMHSETDEKILPI
jgi:hypothetical protein